MKTKMLAVVAALLGVASVPAHAGVHVGISIGLPLPVFVAPPVVVAPAPVYVAPAPCVPAPVVVGCPGPGYVYSPSYWSVGVYGGGRCWVPGGWHCGPSRGFYGHGFAHCR